MQDDYADVIRTDTVGDAFTDVPRRERILQIVQTQFDRDGSVPPDCPIRPPQAPPAIAWGDIEIEELRKIEDAGPDDETEASNIDQTLGSPELGAQSRAPTFHPEHLQVSNTQRKNENENKDEDEMDINVSDPIEDDDDASPLRLTGGAAWVRSPVQQQPSWPPSSPAAVRSASSSSLSDADKATLRAQNLTKKWTLEDKNLLITGLAEDAKAADIHFTYLPHRSLESVRKQARRYRVSKVHEIAKKKRDVNNQVLRDSRNRQESRAPIATQQVASSVAQGAPTPVDSFFQSPKADIAPQESQGSRSPQATPATQATQTAMYTVPESPQPAPEQSPDVQKSGAAKSRKPAKTVRTDEQIRTPKSAGSTKGSRTSSSKPQENATATTPFSSKPTGARPAKVAPWTEEHDKIFEQAIRNNKDWRTLRSRNFPNIAQEAVMAHYADIRAQVEEKDAAVHRIRISQELKNQGEPASTEKEPFNEWENDFLLAARLEGSEIKRLAKSHFPLRTSDVVAKHATKLFQDAQRAARKWLKSQNGSQSTNNRSNPTTDELLDAMNPAKRLRVEAKQMQIRRQGKQISADRNMEYESSVKRAEDKARTIGVQAGLQKSLAMQAQVEAQDRKSKEMNALRMVEDYHSAEAYKEVYAAWEKQANLDKAAGNPIEPEPQRQKGSSIGIEIAITKPKQVQQAADVNSAGTSSAPEKPQNTVATSNTAASTPKDSASTRKRRKSLLEVRIDVSKKQKLDNDAKPTEVNHSSHKPELNGRSPSAKSKRTSQHPVLAPAKVQGSDSSQRSQPLSDTTHTKANIASHTPKPATDSSTPKQKARKSTTCTSNTAQPKASNGPTAAQLLAGCPKTKSRQSTLPFHAEVQGSSTSSSPSASVPAPNDEESFSDPDLDDEALSELIERSSMAFPSSPPQAGITTPLAKLTRSIPNILNGTNTNEDVVIIGSRNIQRNIIEIDDADGDDVVITGARTLRSETDPVSASQSPTLDRKAAPPALGNDWGKCKVEATGSDLEAVAAGHEGARSLAREASAAFSPVKRARDTKRPSARTMALQQQYEELKKAPSQAEEVLNDTRSAYHEDGGLDVQIPMPSGAMVVDESEHDSPSAQPLFSNGNLENVAVVDDDGDSVEEIDRNGVNTWVSGDDSDWDDDYMYGQGPHADTNQRRESPPHQDRSSPRSSQDEDMPDARRVPFMPQSAYSMYEPTTQDLRPPFQSSGQTRVYTPTQSELDRDEAVQREEEHMAKSAAEQLQTEGRGNVEVRQSPQPEIGQKRLFRNRTRKNRHKKRQRLDSDADTNSERSSEYGTRGVKQPSTATPAASKKSKQTQPPAQSKKNATQPAKSRPTPGRKSSKTPVKPKKMTAQSTNGSGDEFLVKKDKRKRNAKKRSSTAAKK